MAEFLTDIEIAQRAEMKVINEIAEKAGIPDKYVENYGKYKAKIDYRYLQNELKDAPDANLILVTAINPTPAGEGKTTTTITTTSMASPASPPSSNIPLTFSNPS